MLGSMSWGEVDWAEELDAVETCPRGCGETMELVKEDRFVSPCDGDYFMIRKVPLYQCTECGEAVITETIQEEIEDIKRGENHDPEEVLEVRVYEIGG